ncbi:hypothetical protein BH11BAC2_BH11BAC2_02640 [soil metagenome]
MNSSMKGRFFAILMLMMTLLMASATDSHAFAPDSLKTRWVNGKKYTLHKVVAKDTWSSVSRKYKITIEALQAANPGVTMLKIGQIIQVPFSENASFDSSPTVIQEEPRKLIAPATQGKETVTNKYHIVQKGETLYRISKEYNLTVDELKQLNNLTSNNVSVGVKLKVGSSKSTVKVITTPSTVDSAPFKSEPKPIPAEPMKEDKAQVEQPKEPVVVNPIVPEPVKPLRLDTPAVYSNPGSSRSSVTEKDLKTGASVDKITENGVATWITDGELNQNKFYALHRTAPVGTIIKVTNRMNNTAVFVKVVGFLPDTGDNANVIIKITQAAAQRIGALDQRFTAELTYGISK